MLGQELKRQQQSLFILDIDGECIPKLHSVLGHFDRRFLQNAFRDIVQTVLLVATHGHLEITHQLLLLPIAHNDSVPSLIRLQHLDGHGTQN